jgi:uncharacterized protein YceK
MKKLAVAVLVCIALSGCASSGSNEIEVRSYDHDEGCEGTMAEAASVPLDQVNDAEMVATINFCRTYEEWVAVLMDYPRAAGLSSLSEADAIPYLTATCHFDADAPVCEDARAEGLLD